jgi:hypothetical protein
VSYTPEIPSWVDIPSLHPFDLVLVLRDFLENGAMVKNPKAMLALRALTEKLAITEPENRQLDPKPWVKESPEEGVSERLEAPAVGATLQPRFSFIQDPEEYTPKPQEMGWYSDPDGSGRGRWWLGTMWSDVYREGGTK